MSIYKREGAPHYSFDFQVAGVRFSGSTGTANRRKAEELEAAEKVKAKRAQAEAQRAGPDGPLTLRIATARYWNEVGQHHAGADTTWTNLCRLVDYFGLDKPLSSITGADVAALVSWRRAQTVKGRAVVRDPDDPKAQQAAPLIAPATVNRSTIEPLQKLFNRARLVWKVALPNEPDWRRHRLKEPQERVREVRAIEEDSLDRAIRTDYAPIVAFARASGLRQRELLLRKDQVDLVDGVVTTIGKGRKPIRQPITTEMRAILMTEMANPTTWVFTYKATRAKRGRGGWARGDRRPITASGLKTIWRRSKTKRTGLRLPADLRFHDLRHDFATKLLRDSGNLKIVQRALHHAKIETTTKYAHVMDDEIAAAMEAASARRKRGNKS